LNQPFWGFCQVPSCCICAIWCCPCCKFWAEYHSFQICFALKPRFQPGSATLFQTLLLRLFHKTQITVANNPAFTLSSPEQIPWITACTLFPCCNRDKTTPSKSAVCQTCLFASQLKIACQTSFFFFLFLFFTVFIF
jgi:hypothetical protein